MNKCFKVCRFCATTDNLISIFDTKMPKLSLQRLNTKILYTLGITVQITDKATQICTGCAELINNFDNYKQNALKINEAVAEIAPLIHPNAFPKRVSNMVHKMAQSSFSFLSITKQVDVKDEVKSETISNKEPQSNNSGDMTNSKDCDPSTDNEHVCCVVPIDTDDHNDQTIPSESETIAIERTVEITETQLSVQTQLDEHSSNNSEQLSLETGEGNNEDVIDPTTKQASYATKIIKLEAVAIEETIEAAETSLNLQLQNSNQLEACNSDNENDYNDLMLKIDDTTSCDEPMEVMDTFDTFQNKTFTDNGVDSAKKGVVSLNFSPMCDYENNNDSDLVSSIDSNISVVVLNRDIATHTDTITTIPDTIYPRSTIEENAPIIEDLFNMNDTENLMPENNRNILNDNMNIFYFNNEFNDCMDIAEVEVVTDNKFELQAIIEKTTEDTEIPLTSQMHRDENHPNQQGELNFEITDTSINRAWVDLEVADIYTTKQSNPEPILVKNIINATQTSLNLQVEMKGNTPKQQEVLDVGALDIRKEGVQTDISTTDQNKLEPIATIAAADTPLNLQFQTVATVEYSNIKDNFENSQLSNLLDRKSLKTVSGSKKLICWLCKITLSSFRKLRLHIKIMHPQNNTSNQLYSMEYEDFRSKARSSVLINYATAIDCKLALIPTICLENLNNFNILKKIRNEIEKEDTMKNGHYLLRQRKPKTASGNGSKLQRSEVFSVKAHCTNIKSKSAKRLTAKEVRTNPQKAKSQRKMSNGSKSLNTKASTSSSRASSRIKKYK